MNKAEIIEALTDATCSETVAEIECGICHKTDGDFIAPEDEEEFAKEMYRKGWRADSDTIYCPKCRKKMPDAFDMSKRESSVQGFIKKK